MAIAIGSTAASVSIKRIVLRRAGTSLRGNARMVAMIAAIVSACKTSGSCRANSVGRYDHGMSGTEKIVPSNISFHGFSKKFEKYVAARNGWSGSMIDHGQINP